LEDIDAAFPKNRAEEKADQTATAVREALMPQNYLTFSGVLNAIDGISAQEGRLFFMTTNYIERYISICKK
jgi:chaperone BCS1